MKQTSIWAAISLLPLFAVAQNIGIGTTNPHPSAALDIAGTKGLLLPRMTTSVRNNIGNPANGLLVYDSTLGAFAFHNGTIWTEMVNTGNNLWQKNASNMYSNFGNVGIGTISPGFALHVVNNNPADGGWAQGIVIENKNPIETVGEAGISFKNASFSANKQWTIGINQASSPLAFNFGSTFAGVNTRMVIDTLGRVAVGTISPEESAQMQIQSTNRGLILPRMTSAQRNAIADPALGLFVYDTDKHCLYMFDGMAWVAFAQQAPGFVPVSLRTVDTIPQSILDIGTEVAVDGELAVTKSTQYEINGLADVGCVFVYKKNGGRWDYVQHIIPNTIKQGAYFGASLALSGNILVVGSPYWDANLVDKGKIWYYQWDGTAFQFLDSLVISPGTTGAYFGFSVALKGNTLVVGASQEDINGNEAGGIYVYTFNPATARFGNRIRLSPPNPKPGDKLGYSVDTDGAYIVAGAPFHPFGTGTNKGIAHVWTGSVASWGYQDSCTYASSTTPFERLGLYLSISGNNIVCGANYKLSADHNPGSAIYFRRNGSQWDKMQEIKSVDTDNGSTVPLTVTRGNWLLVGNASEDHLIGPRGNVWIYALESGQWVKKRRIYNYTTNDPSQRWPDALGFDGTSIMIGSYTYNDRQGAVFFTTVSE